MASNGGRAGPGGGIWIASLWLALGVFDAVQTVVVMKSEGMHHAWVRLFAVTVVSWLPWALATPLVLGLGRRFPPVRLRPLSTWIVHVAVALVIGVVFAGWTTLLDVVFNPYADAQPAGFVATGLNRFWNGLLSSLVLYGVIVTVSYALHSRARLAAARTETARLSEGLTKAQLGALRRQIEPHFLFNSLNTVAGLIREGRDEAAIATVVALGNFLRRMLADSNRQEVPLHDELDFVHDYLAIQAMRFAERLSVIIDIPPELRNAPVPNLILQPLIENAIKHGIAKRASGGTIRLEAAQYDGTLELRVANDGPNLAANTESMPPGIGIANVRTRLQSLYGDAAALRIADLPRGGVEVSIRLPLRHATSPV
jgi:hypothetical protein